MVDVKMWRRRRQPNHSDGRRAECPATAPRRGTQKRAPGGPETNLETEQEEQNMKKRLLSAALALAMVLTMLPLSVFAATGASNVDDGTTVTMAADGKTLTWSYQDDGKTQTGTSNSINSGVIVGGIRSSKTGTVSGKYYSSFSEDAYKAGSSFTLLGDVTLPNMTNTNYKSITVDLNGHTLRLGSLAWQMDSTNANRVSAKYSGFSSLTVKNFGTASDGGVTGSLTVKGMNFTLNMTDAASSSSAVAVTLDNSDLTTSNTLSVTLNNSVMGAVVTKKAKVAVNATNGSQIASVMSSKDGTDGASSYTGGTITLGTNSQITGAVGMYGQGTISLTGRSSITGETTLYGAKKGEGGNATATPAWKTTLTVDNSTMGAIKQGDDDENGHRIDIRHNSTVASIKMDKGGSSDIDIASSNIGSGSGAVEIAKGTVDITNSKVGDITAGSQGETSGTTITVGARNQNDTSVVGDIAGVTGGASPTLILNGGKVGTIGGTNGTTPVAVSHEVWGGSAKTAIDKANLKGGLASGYQIKSGDYYTYTTKFQDVIDAYKKNTNAETTLVGETVSGSGSGITITFQWEGSGTPATPQTLATIKINSGNYLTLPSEVNGVTVQYWYDTAQTDPTKEGLQAGKPYQFDKNTTLSSKINANPTQKLTGVTAVDANDNNAPINATISGNTINLSGALKTNGETGKATITLEIDGTELTSKPLNVGWHAPTGTITVTGTPGNGITFPISRSDQVQIFDTLYTITGKGLKAKVSKVEILSNLNSVPITVSNANGGMSGSYLVTGQNLKKDFEDSTKSSVDFSNAAGVKAALNALVAGLNESQVTSMVNSARNALAAYHNKVKTGGKTDHKAADYAQFDTVELSPYLDIVAAGNPTISGSNNPSMTLTVVLKYRYKVKDANGDYAFKDKDSDGEEIPWEQTGNLAVSGDCGTVSIKLNMPTELAFTNKSYAHHSGQVYEMTWNNNAATIANTNGFAVTKFEINNTEPTVEVKNGSDTLNFDNLQDAVNAVKNNGEITVKENFKGTINVTGSARAFTITAEAGKTVTLTGVNGASTTYDYDTSSNSYKIQLTENTNTSVTISVNTATGGSASVSSGSAKPGDTVTVTPRASNGYKVSGVTAVTNTGASVPVKANSNGTYTFTVPANATKVTVTPRFVASENRIFPDVDPKSWYGPSVKYCYETTVRGVRLMEGDANGNFAPNAKLTRAQMVQMLYNLAGRPTVTGACPFPDVVGTGYDWAAAPITWAAQKGYVIGYSDGKFHPEVNVSRQDMVLILYRYAKQPAIGASGSLSGYYDASSVGSWAYDAVRWAASMGILSGTNSVALNGYINGPVRANRCEVAVTLANFHRLYG